MRVNWKNTVEVTLPVEQVYERLADFERHSEWSRSLVRMEKVRDGDARGVGTRYITHERIEFPAENGGAARVSTLRTLCEVRELSPHRRIAWHAHPLPRVGSSDLCFELEPAPDGGTRITQTVREYYPWPIALMMRARWNITADGIRAQLDRGLKTLQETLNS